MTAHTSRVKIFFQNRSVSHRFQDKCLFAFYAEIQDGCQKWQENDFWLEVADDSAYTLHVKNFIQIFSMLHSFPDKIFCI